MPHPLINEKFNCQLALYLCILAPLHSIVDRGEHEKYLFLPLYGNTENSLATACTPELISHSEKAKGDYALFSELFNILQNILSKNIAS